MGRGAGLLERLSEAFVARGGHAFCAVGDRLLGENAFYRINRLVPVILRCNALAFCLLWKVIRENLLICFPKTPLRQSVFLRWIWIFRLRFCIYSNT